MGIRNRDPELTSMAHIELPPGLAGIRGLLAYRPETAQPLNDLVAVLLHGPHTLTPGERELIATCVSAENECTYCASIHGAVAAQHLGDDEALVEQVKHDRESAPISEKMKALLQIAAKTAEGGGCVTAEDVARAREHGATDLEIHDTVLIAAVFCLCNRYVDGLATWTPEDPEFYRARARVIADHGYTLAATKNS